MSLLRPGTIALLVGFGFVAGIRAEDESVPKGPADEITFQFLPPPVDDARYSIGVFDAKDELVRRLHEGTLESSFPAALNGLIVRWNAKDDAGKRLPNGHYQLRGYAVGPMTVTGIATKGNDWLADDPALRVAKIEGVVAIPKDGGLVVAARLTDGSVSLFRFAGESQGGKLLWKRSWPGEYSPNVFAASEHQFFAAAGKTIVAGNLGSDELDREFKAPSLSTSVKAIAVDPEGNQVFLTDGIEHRRIGLSSPGGHVSKLESYDWIPGTKDAEGLALSKPATKSPKSVISMVPRCGGVIALCQDGSLYSFFPEGEGRTAWLDVKLSSKARPMTIAPGSGKTCDEESFWALEAGRLREYSYAGKLLRALDEPNETRGEVTMISAAQGEERLYLLETLGGTKGIRLRGISLVDSKSVDGQLISSWRTFLERRIDAPEKLKALDAGATLRVDLVKNPFGPRRGGQPTLTLQAMTDERGAYLGTTDGLRLRQVSSVKGLTSAALAKGDAKGSIRFFQRDASASEEFLISGVDRIMAFDVGGCEINERGEVLQDGEAPDPK